MAGRRVRAIMAAVALLASAAGCGRDEVEPLHGMERPSAERRAGLPEVRGRWLFAGWEVAPRDTAAIRNDVYALTPPGEFRFLTQRLDSVAGQYGRPGQVLPFVGEVRRDSIFALLAFMDAGVQQFASGRVIRDTLWLELTNLSMAERWPPRTRAAFVRQAPRGGPFTRLLGGIPIIVPPDSAMLDSLRRDSLRADSVARAAAQPAVVPGAVQPGVPGQPVVPAQPGAVPPGAVVPRPAAPQPGVARPPVTGARPTVPQPGVARPPVTGARPATPQPGVARPPATVARPPAAQPGVVRAPAPAARPPAAAPQPRRPVAPRPAAPRPANTPRDTLRIGTPPTPAPTQPAPIIPTMPRETIRIGVPG